MAEGTDVKVNDLRQAVRDLNDKVSKIEAELVRNEGLVVSVADLKTMMMEHMGSSTSKSERLEQRLVELQLQMAQEVSKLQKALLIATLGGAGAGATAMKFLAPLFGG